MADDPFVISDDRYSRLRLIGWWDQEKLRRAKVLVVGAGALGNEVLKNLALLGWGNIWIVDFDDVEDSNLTRSILFRESHRGRNKAEVAAEAAEGINPDVHVTPLAGNVITELGLGLFREMDVVIGCLDNREARLWVNRQCWKVTRPWIDAGIQEINGVVKVFVPPDSACYECGMTENDYRLINLRYSCPLLRREDILAGKVPTAPTIASMIGGMQVQEALKLLHGLPIAAGEAFVFNGLTNQMYRTAYQHKEGCLSHETFPEATALPLGNQTSVAEFFAAVRDVTGWQEELTLDLDRDLVVDLHCQACDHRRRIMRPQQAVSHREATCPNCNELAKPRMIHAITSSDEAFADEPLAGAGIPPYDIVRVTCGEQDSVFLLEADRAAFFPEADELVAEGAKP